MTHKPNPYEQNLEKNPANYAPLTPLQFLERAAYVYPNHPSLVHSMGSRRVCRPSVRKPFS